MNGLLQQLHWQAHRPEQTCSPCSQQQLQPLLQRLLLEAASQPGARTLCCYLHHR